MNNVDLGLETNDQGTFDIAIDPLTGDFVKTTGFDTALAMSLFCERRADKSEMPPVHRRRGWWGNLVGVVGFEIGSKLWIVDQSRKNQETLNRAIDYAKKGLQWLVDDGHLISFEVKGGFSTGGIKLVIVLHRSHSASESRSFELWDNTEKENGI